MSMVSTNKSKVQRAINFVNQDSIWLGIGKTSIWGSPDIPPVYDPIDIPENNIWWTEVTGLTEAIGYKKIQTKSLVKPDPSGIIEVLDEAGISTKWTEVSQVDAFSQNAKYVYLTVLLDDSLPYSTFRQLIVFSNLVLVGGLESRIYAIPSEVLNPGAPELVQNVEPIARSSNIRQRISLVYEF